ncbi:MAG TPA: HAMP domain-containing sensor histidine kinase [Candidatus Binatia bacterium]|jgi:signal transduction histidine kinase|nr:HAMP domain-containing sensor histidine kinase [Candidatus Binatia bacterium]
MDQDRPSYASALADRIEAGQRDISRRWLARLTELLPVDVRDVFPSDQLLDHIPTLIDEIAAYLRAPDDEEFAANTTVISKAQELGLLRHGQQASVHQILREYALLGTVLETVVAEATATLPVQPTPGEIFAVTHRVGRAVQALMQMTVDTFVSAYTDTITRQTEQLGSFNRMVSHELRNPLHTVQLVLGMLTSASDGDLPALRTRVAPVLQRNVTRMADILHNLEALVRAREMPDTPIVQVVEIGAVAAEVARQLADVAAARDVTIRIAPELPAVNVDMARLELALMNVVSNAIKYSDPEKTHRHIEIGGSIDDGRCTVAVRDNGLGIPADVVPQLFHRRFLRAHGHLDRQLGNDGSGLGLSIVHECLGSLGGTVHIESTEGQGTTVVLQLPCQAP